MKRINDITDPKLALRLLVILQSTLVAEADIEVLSDEQGKVELRRPEKPCMHCKQPTRHRCSTGACESGRHKKFGFFGVGTPFCGEGSCVRAHGDEHLSRMDR